MTLKYLASTCSLLQTCRLRLAMESHFMGLIFCVYNEDKKTKVRDNGVRQILSPATQQTPHLVAEEESVTVVLKQNSVLSHQWFPFRLGVCFQTRVLREGCVCPSRAWPLTNRCVYLPCCSSQTLSCAGLLSVQCWTFPQ